MLGEGESLGSSLALSGCGGVSSAEATATALRGLAFHPQMCSDKQLLKLLEPGCV